MLGFQLLKHDVLQMDKRPRNLIAKDLRTPKYKMRVIQNKKYKKDKHKHDYRRNKDS